MEPLSNRQRIEFVLSNAFWGTFWGLFLYARIVRFPTLSSLGKFSEALLIAGTGILLFLFIFRKSARKTSWSLIDILTSFLGTFAPFFFKSAGGQIHTVGLIFQSLGCLFFVVSALSLNLSFGVLPALRKIRTGGAYRLVRHPVYASYQFMNAGYVINHFGFYNLTVAVLCLLSQILRIYAEERFMEQDPAYREYQKQTKWRLIPFIF